VPKTFGTDIHRHTVEFSKNTRTPSLPKYQLQPLWGNRSNLSPAASRRKPGRSGHLESIETCSVFSGSSGACVQPRVPGLSVGVGVRVALTWNKLRE
ncbi:hypothetical protein, partial [Rhodococcus koreensis]|uniref:hypothetical protein n=1 Tax=Rhodococcus koreensis TaxID=99653 RepID=UPI0036D95EFB